MPISKSEIWLQIFDEISFIYWMFSGNTNRMDLFISKLSINVDVYLKHKLTLPYLESSQEF